MVVYFSGTGNSKYVAERIAGSLQEKLLCMNERIKSGNTGSVKTGENLVVVVPTYAWRIPRVVSDWIGQTEFVGAKNVWYVMSCGSGIGGADIYNRKLSEKKGIKHMGTAQIIMPENYIAMFNAPDVEKAKKIVAAAGPDIAKAVLAIKHGEKLPCCLRLITGIFPKVYFLQKLKKRRRNIMSRSCILQMENTQMPCLPCCGRYWESIRR